MEALTHLPPFPGGEKVCAFWRVAQFARRPRSRPSLLAVGGRRVAARCQPPITQVHNVLFTFVWQRSRHCGSLCELTYALFSCQRTMRSNAWTTLEEFTFLEDLVPQFVSQQKVRVVGPWLAEKAAAFFAKFPLRSAEFDRDRLTKVCFISMEIYSFAHAFHSICRNYGHGLGTTPETLSKERTRVMFSTSLAGPTADRSPYSRLKHTLRSIIVKALPYTRRSRTFMRCTSLVTLRPFQPSRDSSKKLLTMNRTPLPSPPLPTPSHTPMKPRHLPKRHADERRLTLRRPPNRTIPSLLHRRRRSASLRVRRLLRVQTLHSTFHPLSTSNKRSSARS